LTDNKQQKQQTVSDIPKWTRTWYLPGVKVPVSRPLATTEPNIHANRNPAPSLTDLARLTL